LLPWCVGAPSPAWFLDGERFLTVVGNTVHTYDRTGASLALAVLPSVENLTGQGDHVWTHAAGTPG